MGQTLDSWSAEVRNRVSEAALTGEGSKVASELLAALRSLPQSLTKTNDDLVLDRSDVLIELGERFFGSSNLILLAVLEHRTRLLLGHRHMGGATACLEETLKMQNALTNVPPALHEAIAGDYASYLVVTGRPDDALRVVSESVSESSSPKAKLKAHSLQAEAYLDLAEGDHRIRELAGNHLKEAYAAAVRLQLDDSLEGADLAINLARFHRETHNLEEAERFANIAYSLRKRLLHSEHPDIASAKRRLGMIIAAKGRFDEAITFLNEAKPILLETYGPSHRETIMCSRDLGLVQYWKGQRDLAVKEARLQLELTKQLILEICYIGTEEDCRFQLRQIHPAVLPGTISGSQDDMLAEATFCFKGIEARAHFEKRQYAMALSDAKTQALAKRWKKELDAFVIDRQRRLKGKSFDEKGLLGKALDETEAELAQHGIRLGDVRKTLTSDFRTLTSRVPKDTVVIDFVLHTVVPNEKSYETRVDALCYLTGEPPKLIQIASENDPPKVALEYGQAVTNMTLQPERFLNASEVARKTFWEPISRNLPKGITKIVIAPEGPISFISFAALIADGHLLAEDYSFRYAPSVGGLFTEKRSVAPRKSAFLFVDPNYDLRPPTGRTNLAKARPLNHTRAEGEAIEKLLKGMGWETSLVASNAVTKDKVKSLRSPGLVLLATHGFWVPSESLHTTSGRNGEAAKRAMASGGLLLSGANWMVPSKPPGRPQPAGAFIEIPLRSGELEKNWDGVITAGEFEDIDLRNTWVLALSACGTGLGEFGSSEGIFGLQRGALTAGARNIMLTAWPIRDSIAATFTPEVLKEALNTGDLASAFGLAQRRMIKRLRVENQMPLHQVVALAGPYMLLSQDLDCK